MTQNFFVIFLFQKIHGFIYFKHFGFSKKNYLWIFCFILIKNIHDQGVAHPLCTLINYSHALFLTYFYFQVGSRTSAQFPKFYYISIKIFVEFNCRFGLKFYTQEVKRWEFWNLVNNLISVFVRLIQAGF